MNFGKTIFARLMPSQKCDNKEKVFAGVIDKTIKVGNTAFQETSPVVGSKGKLC
jgi:hypothetical protein